MARCAAAHFCPQAASLASKGTYKTKDKFQPRNTVTSDETGVNEAGVEGFPGAAVYTGQTGQTGGNDNMIIPPEEGGDDHAETLGTRAHGFEGSFQGGPEDKLVLEAKQNPGAVDVHAEPVSKPRHATYNEAVPAGRPQQQLEADQEAAAAGLLNDNKP